MKKRTLTEQNITKMYRRFNGIIAAQIDGSSWIMLKSSDNAEQLLKSYTTNQLHYCVIDTEGNVVSVSVKFDGFDDIRKKALALYRHN